MYVMFNGVGVTWFFCYLIKCLECYAVIVCCSIMSTLEVNTQQLSCMVIHLWILYLDLKYHNFFWWCKAGTSVITGAGVFGPDATLWCVIIQHVQYNTIILLKSSLNTGLELTWKDKVHSKCKFTEDEYAYNFRNWNYVMLVDCH